MIVKITPNTPNILLITTKSFSYTRSLIFRTVQKASYWTACLKANTAEVLVHAGGSWFESLSSQCAVALPTAPPDRNCPNVHKYLYVSLPSRFMTTQMRNKHSRQSASPKKPSCQTNYHLPRSSRYSATHLLSRCTPGIATTRTVQTQPSCFSEGRFVNEWTTGRGKRLAVRGASEFEGGGYRTELRTGGWRLSCSMNRWLETIM